MFYLDPKAKFDGYTDDGMAIYRVREENKADDSGEIIPQEED